jgi:hypothetical protein
MERNNPKIFQKKNHDEKYEEKKAQKCLSQKTALSSFVTKKPSRHSANFRPRVFFYQKWEFSGPKSADIVYVLLLLSALLAKLYLKQVGFPVF